MYMEQPLQMVVHRPKATLRWFLKMRVGIMAVLGRRSWMTMKAGRRRDMRTSKVMIRALFH
jgi:hypothetical protein